MEKPSFKQVIVINGFSLHQNSTNVNIIFEGDGWWTRKQKRKDYECYTCEVDLDEDEMAHFMQDTYYNCPYFQMGDEYKIVRKQM